MSGFCFHASHEQFAPSTLLRLTAMAEQAGFDAVHCSDHFHPWSKRQGQSGFSFSWLGAAMQATKLPFSTVCAPGQRYHPAVVAQAIATLSEMFPSRFSIELGSGEALNEMITDEPWPSREQRNERLLECVHIIRELLKGRVVTYHGHVNVRQARLYTLPEKLPLLFCAAISEQTSGWAGSWADGLITTGGDIAETEKKINAFKKNGGHNKPFFIQVSFSYASTIEEAVAGAYDQWRTNIIPSKKLADVYTTEQFDELGEAVTKEEIIKSVKMFTTIADLFQWTNQFQNLSPTRIILHNIHPDQELFIKDFGNYKYKEGTV